MSVLGRIKIKDFLEKTKGKVRGTLVTDAKHRFYFSDYAWEEDGEFLIVSQQNGNGNSIRIQSTIELDESLIAFFGLYSGDGAKGSESPTDSSLVKPVISFSQREPNLVKFALDQFKNLFSKEVHFVFSLGEDSAYFMAGEGADMLKSYYKGKTPSEPLLSSVRPSINDADKRYLMEKRSVSGTNEEHLAFYYFHKKAMEEILTEVKKDDIRRAGIKLGSKDRITASLRRPFKKGAREPGGSSRSDEMHVGGVNGAGELFLKVLHEIEDSIYNDSKISPQGLIEWQDQPSTLGEVINIKDFFSKHNFGTMAGGRPQISEEGMFLVGLWSRSKKRHLYKTINIDPLFCYVAGLYLAEGSTPKSLMFSMFSKPVSGLNLSFTSSENMSIDLVIRSMQKLFKKEECVHTWKIKVGSQYFPELVVIGLKNGVPMLRGGESGDGKMRTMEISLSLKPWGLGVAPALIPFQDKYSHVEPTGAGLARIDFSASSSLCRWYFPLLMYAAFGNLVTNPAKDFLND